MQREQYLEHLASDGHRMAEIARGDLSVRVPTCPEWTLQDLIEHTGFVHRWQTAAARENTGDFPHGDTWRFGPAEGQSWSEWFQAGVDAAVSVMGSVDANEARWTWFAPDQTAGFYHRRITQETAVHRIDAELAATGTATTLDPVLATDGIGEIFDVFVKAQATMPVGGNGETALLRPTDIDAPWVVTLHPETVTAVRASAETDVEITATASDLLVFLWGREPIAGAQIRGDQRTYDLLDAAAKS